MSDEDSHATPLNKLPMPMMQNKQSMPPVEMPSYEKLMSDASRPQQAQPDFSTQSMLLPPPSGGMQAMQAPTMQSMQPTQPYAPPMQPTQPYAPPMQPTQLYAPPMQSMQPVQSYVPDYYGGGYHEEEPAKPRPGVMARLLKANQATLIVVAVTFLVLLFVVPRLARMPRFSTPDCRLSVLGKLAASAVVGGGFHASKLVLSTP